MSLIRDTDTYMQYRYVVSEFKAMMGSEIIEFDTGKIRNLSIEKDYENDLFPLLRVVVITSQARYRQILRNRDTVKFKFRLQKYSRMLHDPNTESMKSDYINGTFVIFTDDDTPDMSENVVKLKQKTDDIEGEYLMQETADQEKTEENSWGYISKIGTDIQAKTDAGNGIYETGWYALEGKDIAYQMTLPAGTHEITLGFYDWWGQYENRPMTVYVQTEGGEQTKLCDVPSPGQEQIQASGVLELDKESLVTVTVKRAGSPDPILNWITAVNLDPQEEPSEPVSKTLLERWLNEAKGYVEDGTVSGLVESVQKLFADAIAKGEAVMADENATRDEVIDAAADLMFAIHALGMKAADKTDLEMALELAGMIDLDKYVEAGQAEFLSAKEAAEAVMADGDAMQEETNAAWDALVEAMEALRLKADKSVLQDLVDQVSDTDLSGYTEESVSVFRAALASANAILADASLSEDDQAEVDEAKEALREAYDGLVKTGGEDPQGPDAGDGQSQGSAQDGKPSGNAQGSGSSGADRAAKTGDTAGAVPAAAGMMAVSLLGIAAVLAAKKRRG